jgi:hypothetical protein
MNTRTFPQVERRKELQLSDEHIEQIAERAAVKAMEKLTNQAYMSIGKGVVNKLFVVVGVLASAAYFWALGKGWIK